MAKLDKNHTEITAQRSILLAVITLTFISSIAHVYSPLNMCISLIPPPVMDTWQWTHLINQKKTLRSGENKKAFERISQSQQLFSQVRQMKYWLDRMLFYLYKNTKRDYKILSGCVFVHNNTYVALQSKTKHLQHSDCWVPHQNGCFFPFWCFYKPSRTLLHTMFHSTHGHLSRVHMAMHNSSLWPERCKFA